MEKSKHNIISKLKDSDDYFIVNTLYGQADILDPKTAEDFINNKLEDTSGFVEKSYLVNTKEEESVYKEKYLKFIENRDSDEIQIFFVPWYSCNFSCSYCYQDEYDPNNLPLMKETIDSFFAYVNTKFSGRKKYITLFGGEPLLPGDKAKEIISYFLNSASKNNLSVAIVTNGYTLTEYVNILKKHTIREVQVTLDGMRESQNKRRPLKNGGETFDNVVAGVDALINAKISVNLRMVIDKRNINELPTLADMAIERGWIKSGFFKTQLGRNYELHHCQLDSEHLFNRISMYEEIYKLLKKYPQIVEFHKPAFSISKFLFENGKMPDPLFDACPATKTEWAFDYTGKIYSCTATVGKQGEELGTYYPNITLDEDKVCEWEDRDVLSIDKCKTCSLQLACGGGCGSVAKNNSGKIASPDCRPIKNLLELGISYYFKEEV